MRGRLMSIYAIALEALGLTNLRPAITIFDSEDSYWTDMIIIEV